MAKREIQMSNRTGMEIKHRKKQQEQKSKLYIRVYFPGTQQENKQSKGYIKSISRLWK